MIALAECSDGEGAGDIGGVDESGDGGGDGDRDAGTGDNAHCIDGEGDSTPTYR